MSRLSRVVQFSFVVLVAVMLWAPGQAFALTEQWKYMSDTYKFNGLTDAQSNSYIVETRYQEGILTKISPDGQVLWQFSGKNYGPGMDNNVSVDKDGNVFVHVTDTGRHGWFLTVKLNSNGEVLFATAAFAEASPVGKAVPNNNTGDFSVIVRLYDYFGNPAGSSVVKYDSAGNFLSKADYSDSFFSMTSDEAGNFYVGSYDGSVDLVRKFTADGTPVWIGSGVVQELVQVLKVDTNGDVVAVTPTVVQKFDGVTGNTLWYVPTTEQNADNLDIAFDPSNAVYMVGYGMLRGEYVGIIKKIDATGATIWETSNKGLVQCEKVAMNKSNTLLYVAGQGNILTVTPSKGRVTSQTASGYDVINSMVFDNSGYLYITGNTGYIGDFIKFHE